MFRVTKLLFLTLVLVSGYTLSSQAQPAIDNPHEPAELEAVVSTSSILLWSQTTGLIGNGAPSQRFPDLSDNVGQSADDFEVPAGESWLIRTIRTQGIFGGGASVNQVEVTFYEDDNGKPGNIVSGCDYPNLMPSSNANDANIIIDLKAPCPLWSGTYWISVMLVEPFNPGMNQWFWSTSSTPVLNEFQWRDPGSIFTVPAICQSVVWNNGGTVCGVGGGASAVSLAFELEGEKNPLMVTQRYCSENVPVSIPSAGSGGFPPVFEPNDLDIPLSKLEEITKVTVSMYITHTWDSDLEIFIESPDNTSVELTTDNGGAGNNYGSKCGDGAMTMNPDTIFDDDAATPITSGSAPFVGTWQPEGMLSDFIGEDGDGTWSLLIADDAVGDVGTLHCWCMDITRWTPIKPTTPLDLSPIFPAVESNPNFMNAFPVDNGVTVGFIWGFQLGSFMVNLPCGSIELGIVPFELLGFSVAGFNRVVDFAFYIALGSYANPAFTQAVDLDLCRVSEVVPNIILNTNLK